jgi:hypothetical protein
MARRSPEEKRAIEERRSRHQRRRDETAAREAAMNRHIEAILEQAKARSRDALPVAELVEKLERARMFALATNQPGPAVNAVLAKAKILSLLGGTSAVMRGTLGEFAEMQSEAAIIARLRKRLGTRRTDAFLKLVERIRRGDLDDEDETTIAD